MNISVNCINLSEVNNPRMLEKEFKYFIDNQSDLVKKYRGKHIVIVGNEVVGSYNSVGDAYVNSLKKYEPGTFFIQLCIPGKDAYTQTFNSRVIFA